MVLSLVIRLLVQGLSGWSGFLDPFVGQYSTPYHLSSDMPEFAIDSIDHRITMAFAKDGIAFEARQGRGGTAPMASALRFHGEWGIRAESDVRFFGNCSGGGSATDGRASLQVQTMAVPGQLSVTLRSLDGRVMLGPVVLEEV